MQEKVRCPLCRRLVSADRLESHIRIEQALIENIRKAHPDWVESDGACPECVSHYRQQIARLRGA
jgi:hypothetical protein